MNDAYYESGGPVFILIGGEGSINSAWMNAGAWIEFAQEHNAFCFMLEHRFYGESQPTPDLSINNLQYLNSKQAIADLANFITSMNAQYNLTSYWIAFGGSYAGALAVWLREKHPELVIAAISSSGPILAKADFFEYFQIVENSLRTYSDDCANSIGNAISQMNILMYYPAGRSQISSFFNFCTSLESSANNSLDISRLYEALANGIAGIVQYDTGFRWGTQLSIANICDIMTDPDNGLELNRLSMISQQNLDRENLTCLDFRYSSTIYILSEISWDSPGGEGGLLLV